MPRDLKARSVPRVPLERKDRKVSLVRKVKLVPRVLRGRKVRKVLRGQRVLRVRKARVSRFLDRMRRMPSLLLRIQQERQAMRTLLARIFTSGLRRVLRG